MSQRLEKKSQVDKARQGEPQVGSRTMKEGREGRSPSGLAWVGLEKEVEGQIA